MRCRLFTAGLIALFPPAVCDQVTAKFWREFGGHDPGLGVFGCENIEISTIIWSFGGRLLVGT